MGAKLDRAHGLAGRIADAVGRGELAFSRDRASLSPLVAEAKPDSLVELEDKLDSRLPHVELGELLVEVDRWTGFSAKLVQRSTKAAPTARWRPPLYAAILAQATNTGFTRMAQIAGATFDQLAWASSWHLREETLKRAFSLIADFQHAHPLSTSWGGGVFSSSDGQRFPVSGKSKIARAIPRYFNYGRGVTFYTWTSDQFSQYGVKVIPATSRDATYVLDELLDNETELEILEHSTDTHGYTDLVFALFDLLGMRFSPRLRDVAGARLYVQKGADLSLPPPFDRPERVDAERIERHWDELLRIASSLKSGHVTASLLVGKLQAQPKRGVVAALQDYGRLCKTEHILRYYADEAFRRRVGRQLNKGEAIHALRRFLVFGNIAKLRRKDTDALANQAGCLNLVSNAVIAWNTVYMALALQRLRDDGFDVRDDDVARLSPARYEHINPFGRYRFDRLPKKGRYRPLRG